jgi:serine/threonine protein kinase
MNKNPCPTTDRLLDYSLGKLALADLELVEHHIGDCDSCQETVNHLDLNTDTFVAGIRAPAASDPHHTESALHDALQATRKVPARQNTGVKLSPAESGDHIWQEGLQPRTASEFLDCLAASKLTCFEAAKKVIDKLVVEDSAADAKTAAAALVTAGTMTAFQARAIYQGKAGSLVIAGREILDLLGKGGMGNVYRAHNRRLDRVEALKVISAEKLATPEAIERFHREARAAARLNHPNVVITYDAGEANGLHYLCMEYVDGADLSKTVKEHGPLAVEHAVACIVQAARGLHVAHDKGIIHRDIKPHNLLLDRQGHVKILDMGLALINESATSIAAQEGLTQSGQIMGTIDFMSPEQIMDVRHVAPASDVYSLGCTLHYLLTGKPPYEGDSLGAKILAHHQSDVPSLRTARPEVSPELDDVFQRMLAKTPAARLSTMNDVIAALESSGSASMPNPLSPAAPAPEISKLDAFLSKRMPSQDVPVGRAHEEASESTIQLQPRATSGRWRPLLLAPAALAVIALIIGAIVWSVKTPHGELEVVLDDGVADNVSLVVSQGGKQVDVLDKADRWKISLTDGKYEVTVPPASADRFTVDQQTVTIERNTKQLVRVSLKPINPAPAAPFAVAAERKDALQFNGNSYVEIPKFAYDGSTPLTYEVKLVEGAPLDLPSGFFAASLFDSTYATKDRALRTWGSFVSWDIDLTRKNPEIHVASGGRGEGIVFKSMPRPKVEKLIHLAIVWDKNSADIFIDGRKVSEGSFKYPAGAPKEEQIRTRIGLGTDPAENEDRGYRGVMQGIRLSRIARYKSAYVPPEQFEKDADTHVLYKFDEGTGNVLHDLSGNGLDGKIVGAKWVTLNKL